MGTIKRKREEKTPPPRLRTYSAWKAAACTVTVRSSARKRNNPANEKEQSARYACTMAVSKGFAGFKAISRFSSRNEAGPIQ